MDQSHYGELTRRNQFTSYKKHTAEAGSLRSSDGFINIYKFGGEKLELKVRISAHGYINGIEFTRQGEYLVAAIGRDYKIGRWNSSFKTNPGLLRIHLNLPFRSGELDLIRFQDKYPLQ